jgi:hypothetical protein
MKGKILSALFSLMLVFGMIFAACDNGAAPKIEPATGQTILDTNGAGFAIYVTDDDGNHTGKIEDGKHGNEKLNSQLGF